jgi:hypothetical protein
MVASEGYLFKKVVDIAPHSDLLGFDYSPAAGKSQRAMRTQAVLALAL